MQYASLLYRTSSITYYPVIESNTTPPLFLDFFAVLYDSNDIEEHLEETAAEAEPEPEPEPEQEPEPEVHEEKSEPVLEESAPEETVEKSPSPAPADPAPAVQEDSRVMKVDGSFL